MRAFKSTFSALLRRSPAGAAREMLSHKHTPPFLCGLSSDLGAVPPEGSDQHVSELPGAAARCLQTQVKWTQAKKARYVADPWRVTQQIQLSGACSRSARWDRRGIKMLSERLKHSLKNVWVIPGVAALRTLSKACGKRTGRSYASGGVVASQRGGHRPRLPC